MFKKSITLDDKELFDQYVYSFTYDISCINFTCLYMWRKFNKLTYEVINDYLCIAGEIQNKPFTLPPLTKKDYDQAQLTETLDILHSYFKRENKPFLLKLVPKHLNNLIDTTHPGKYEFHADRDNFDYVYLTENLITLKGRKLHSKKNHWNYFMKNIPHEYVPLTKDLIDGSMDLVKELKEGPYTDLQLSLLDSEEEAIYEALSNMDKLKFKGGAIIINDKVEAFTFGEPLNSDTMVVHIEKANSNFRGLYQGINQQFCQRECGDFKYVNREEDMGFEYLRKAKKSYRPVKMIEKYDVTLVEEGKNGD